MTKQWHHLATTVLFACVVHCCAAGPIPILNLADLTEKADLIVVGRLTAMRQNGTTIIDLQGNRAVAIALIAEMQVDEVLKGSLPQGKLTFELLQPDIPDNYGSVPVRSTRIVFLSGWPGNYKPTSSYYPSIVAAARSASSPSTSLLDSVVERVAAVINPIGDNKERELEAISVLNWVQGARATLALNRALQDSDTIIRLSAAAALLGRNDLSAMSLAESALLHTHPAAPEYVLHNLAYAISAAIRDERAVPSLSRLLHAESTETRRAAASGLCNIGSYSAVGPLLTALHDSDSDVRYYAVIGLAEITGQDEWRPLKGEFRSNERKYLNHWLEWEQGGRPK